MVRLRLSSRPRLGLLATFGVAAIVPIVGLALVLGHLLRTQIRDRAFDETRQSARVVGAALESQLSARNLNGTLPRGRLLAVDGLIASLRSRGLDEAILWNRKGRVVYSTDRPLVGRTLPPSDDLLRALRGEAVSGMKRPGRGATSGALLDVFVPLGFGLPQTSGALELVSPSA